MPVNDSQQDGSKLFFIFGMRRSGTSILRKIIAKSKDVTSVLFEPHELWHSVMMQHFKRFRSEEHQKRIDEFKRLGKGEGWAGSKFALNPGIDALDWVWFPRVFKTAKFIFILRNMEDTFASYVQQDCNSFRGAVPLHVYQPMYAWLQGRMWYYWDTHRDSSCLVYYDKMIIDPETALDPVWKLLDIEPVTGLEKIITIPVNWKKGEDKGNGKNRSDRPDKKQIGQIVDTPQLRAVTSAGKKGDGRNSRRV